MGHDVGETTLGVGVLVGFGVGLFEGVGGTGVLVGLQVPVVRLHVAGAH